jgi:hypothetical protein
MTITAQKRPKTRRRPRKPASRRVRTRGKTRSLDIRIDEAKQRIELLGRKVELKKLEGEGKKMLQQLKSMKF